jgi:hypothetical protein
MPPIAAGIDGTDAYVQRQKQRGSWEHANAFFRLLRYHAADLRQNRHRRQRLAVRRAFAPMLIYQPDARCYENVASGRSQWTCAPYCPKSDFLSVDKSMYS